jgi:hypothetical protein
VPRSWKSGCGSHLRASQGEAERLRAGLDARIEREGESAHGAPKAETKLWLDALADLDRKCARYQELAAEDLIHFEEPRACLAELEDTRTTAEQGLRTPRNRHKQILQFEQDGEMLPEAYVGPVSEALDGLWPRPNAPWCLRASLNRAHGRRDGCPSQR